MSTEVMCDIQFWATVASPIIGAVAIIVALIISYRSSRRAKDALRDIVAHQADIDWGHLQHYFMTNEFEMTEEENRLGFIQKKIAEYEKDSTHARHEMDDLKMQEQLLSTRIKNRKILRNNYVKILGHLDQSTKSILFEKTSFGENKKKE